MFNNS